MMRIRFWLWLTLCWLVMACATDVAQQRSGAGASDAVAIVNGTAITNAEVEASLGQGLATLEEQIYELKKTKLESLIDEALIAGEAKKRGISTDALIQAEVTAKLAPVTDEQIAGFYSANQARLQKDLAGWRDQIRMFLLEEREAERREAFAKELRATATVELRLPAPKIFRSEVSIAGAFAKGPAAAPVTIVEFSDFHCPFCKRAQPVLSQVLAKYGDKVRLVYKDFPLDSLHPQARIAAEAGRCAGEQNKFWEFHDRVYAGASDSSLATLGRYAKEIAVGNQPAFEACVKARKYQAQVQRDVAEGAKLGVSGTPAFFINGRLLSGAQPLDAFAAIIDAELALQGAR